MNQRQLQVIDYLKENQVLREQLGDHLLRLTNDDGDINQHFLRPAANALGLLQGIRLALPSEGGVTALEAIRG